MFLVFAVAVLTRLLGFLAVVLATSGVWLLFATFTFVFFRDPTPCVPTDHDAIVAPAHGLVDFVGSRCDLYLPSHFHVLARPGDRVTGGETVVARESAIRLAAKPGFAS
ncbi:MAG TPA: hypothetical protein GYA07_06270 [Verrucomicrobia bacterium]|nr:hypothetical protein [Verrucomicrobiota bacterium]